LHPLFETLASHVADHNDAIAERAVILGGRAYGTARHTAASSRLPEYPQDTTRDLDHARLLAEQFAAYLAGLRLARNVAEHSGDTDTVDLLTGIISACEKDAWFLHATAE
ncbi:MAG TPA: ferritin-like domain-containing protein, partial [Pseudomonadota bacterium]|nr:ferritin-like domain-containing protein [Pseudomonadota bacterium]